MDTLIRRATVVLTWAQYNALATKDINVQYLITDAEYLKVEYSANGSTWVSTVPVGVAYMRISTNNGISWSDALPIKGEMTGPSSSTDGNLALFDGITGKILKDSGKKASDFLGNVVEDTTPELGGDLDLKTFKLSKSGTGKFELGTDEKQFDFNSNNAHFTLINNTNATTIDWRKGNKQTVAPTSAPTYTFTAPDGACNLMLRITQPSTALAITFPASVEWYGATPDFVVNSAKFLVCFFYDGTTYAGTVVKKV